MIGTGLNAQAADIAAITPVGVVLPYAGSSAPTGYLLCDGTAVSRTTYAALFAVIGTSYGAGNGTTTFNLPDLRGRLPLGKDNMGGSSADRVVAAAADSLGGSGGAETHTLTTSEIPAHSHDTTISTATGVNAGYTSFSATDTSANSGNKISTATDGGGGGAHNNMPPYMTFNYIIRHVTYT